MIGMKSDRISTIEDWSTPKSMRDVQVLLGVTNFHQRFIREYARVPPQLSDLLRESPVNWNWTLMGELAV